MSSLSIESVESSAGQDCHGRSSYPLVVHRDDVGSTKPLGDLD